MKRRLSLLLAVVMILGSFSFAFAADEVDPAKFLEENKILVGDKSGDLMLDKPLLRRDAVVILSRLMKAEDEAKKFKEEGLPTFKDITDKYYTPYLAWAQSNKYIKGHTEERFGFNDNLTTKEFATVLLRALGYIENAEDWDKVFDEAKKLELLEGVEKEADAELVRKEVAQMIYNALGVKMKDSDKTLAEFLGIEMPAPKELKVEKVYTENLREIVVELSNAKLADEEKLTDVNNYKLAGFKVEKVTVDADNVIVLLEENTPLVKNKNYELVIRNVDKAVNGTYKFKAEDNTIPAVEKVEALGEYGIKVTTTEPVEFPAERSFLVDGKNIAMVVEQYGRDIILTPYHDKAFPEDAKTLTVKGLKDYADFKSVEEDFEIEIKKDEVAPKVVDVIVKGSVVEVVFDKDIYRDSVSGYLHGKATGNISYKDGRHTIYTKNEYYEEGSKKIDTNKVAYYFEKELPRRAEITIEGVTNHSKVAMEKVTTEGRIVVDYSEPEIMKSELWDYTRGEKDGEATAVVRIYFDKDVEGIYINKDNKELGFKPSEHFDLYLREVTSRNLLTQSSTDYEKYVKSVNYVNAGKDTERKDVIEVKLANLNVNTLERDFDYILEVRNFTDTTSFRNRMYRDYVEFSIPRPGTAFNITEIKYVKEDNVETEIAISFNKPVDREIAEDPTNYLFTHVNGVTKHDVKDLGGDIIVERDGKTVTLVLPGFKAKKASYKTLEVLQSIKDIYGGRLAAYNTIFDLSTGKITNPPQSDIEIAKFKSDYADVLELKVNEVEIINKARVEAALVAYESLSPDAKAGLKDEKAHLDELASAILELEPVKLQSATETRKHETATPATPSVYETDTLVDNDKITVEGKEVTITDVNDIDDYVTTFNTLLSGTGITASKHSTDSKLIFTRADGKNINIVHVDENNTEKTVTNTTPGVEAKPEVKQRIALTLNKEANIQNGAIVTGVGTGNVTVVSVNGKVVEIELDTALTSPATISSNIQFKSGQVIIEVEVSSSVSVTFLP